MSDNEQVAPSWSVAIFAARERLEDLERTIHATVAAVREDTVIDILVNGNPALADQVSKWARQATGAAGNARSRLRVWSILLGDKAHTWNQYLYTIWPKSKIAFFIDGYVRVDADSFERLAAGLLAFSGDLAGTGVPSVGRSAKALRDEMLKTGGIHGNLFALKAATIEALKAIKFKLPLGLYRTDPILGAALSFNLAPSKFPWNPKGRILVHPGVTWKTDERSFWKFSDVSGQVKRVLRQGQGILEDLAVKNLFATQRLPPEQLPITAADLVFQWARSHPNELRNATLRHPLLIWLGLRKLHQPRIWTSAGTPPDLRYP